MNKPTKPKDYTHIWESYVDGLTESDATSIEARKKACKERGSGWYWDTRKNECVKDEGGVPHGGLHEKIRDPEETIHPDTPLPGHVDYLELEQLMLQNLDDPHIIDKVANYLTKSGVEVKNRPMPTDPKPDLATRPPTALRTGS